MPASDIQRLYFRDKFKSLFNDAFQNWLESIARRLHPNGDFVKIRKTSGDGGLDGFVISSQLVYQAYAPARINELNDSETAAKIRADFQTASKTLDGKLKNWVFVHNHPEAALGKLSVAAINELRGLNPKIDISVLDIDSLWEKLKVLPDPILNELCGGPPPDPRANPITEEISDLRKDVSAGFTKTQDALNQLPGNLHAEIKSAIKSAMAEGSQEAEHLKSQNQKWFDRAREELIDGSVVVAEKEYRALVAALESQGTLADTRLLFRAYTNLGTSLWQQFRRDEAVVWFDKAYTTKPDEPKAKTNKAAAHIHRKEFQAAFTTLNELIAAQPDYFEAYYLMSGAHLEQGKVGEAIAVLEAKPFENDGYFEALAEAYLRRESYPEAVNAARAALAKNPNLTEAQVTLANALGFPLVQRRMRREIKAFSLSDAERQQVVDAIKAGESAVRTLREKGRNFQLGETLTNLSAFYELVEDDENAARSAREAAEFAPNNITTLTNLWASQMRLGKYPDAYDTAGKLIHLGAKLPGKIRQLESLQMNSEHGRLLREAASDPDTVGELSKDPRFFELKAHAQFETHQVDAAFDTIKEGLARFPDDARLYCARASLYENLGQTSSAEEDIERAENVGANEPRTVVHVAMFHFHHSDWAAAAQRFVKVGADSIHSPFLDNYLVCLHNLGKYPECFALATKAIVATGGFNATLHELAARCAYNANDLPSAQQHFETLVQHGTGKVAEYQKMLAQVYLRLDEPDRALAVLKKAYARTSKDIDVLIGLSFVSTLKGQHKEAVGYGFAAVNAAGKNPRAHTAFVKAALDCPPEIKISDKYRKAFQRSLEFLNKHPSGFIKAIPFEKDLKSFIAMAKARADHAHRIEDLIQQKNLPMAILAQQLGVPAFNAWMGLMGHTRLHVHMAYGTTQEQIKEAETALAAKSVCVDIFALFSLRLLNQLALLPKLYSKIFVHTAVLEAIVENIREMELRKTGMTISYHEGKLVRTEVGEEQTSQQLSFLRDIRDFLKSPPVELVGLDAALLSTDDMKKAREFLGVIYYEPIMVSKSRAAVYYADDAPMRSLASNSHGVASFCTQALLRAAKEKQIISDAQYEDAIITLLRHNYYFVSESFETLGRLAQSEGFEPSELARAMLRRVADPKVDQSTAVRIVSDFSFFIWRADLSKAKVGREMWLEICLDSLLQAKQPETLFTQFLANLGVRALTHPAAFGGIAHWILRSAKLSRVQRGLFYIAVQEAIAQMARLAGRENPWWPTVQKEWLLQGRLNVILYNNGWLLPDWRPQ